MIKTTIVGFGDSISTGFGIGKVHSYMNRLEKFVPSYYPSISWNMINSSKNGATTKDALHGINASVLANRPNVVFMQFGTNDSANDHRYHSLEDFEHNYENMIKLILEHNNRTGLNNCEPIPVLITPPPVNEGIARPLRNNSRLNQFIHIIKRLAHKYNCPLIDFYSKVLSQENHLDYIAEDGVHLNQKGYDLLFDTVFAEFTKLINYQGVLKEREVNPNDW